MSSQVEKDYQSLMMMTHEIAFPVCKTYFKTNVLLTAEYNGDLKTFLNKHKHDIHHLVHKIKCCQCGNPSANNNNKSKRLFVKQLNKLFAEVDAKVRNHVLYGPGSRITQHCICGLRVVEGCSVDDMDICMVNAIIQTCVQGLDPSHIMWLDKIIDKRNELSHIDDFSRLTTDYTKAAWDYIEGSVLGLAQSITPTQSYKESIEREFKFFRQIEHHSEKVKPILDSIKEECANVTDTMCKISTQLNGMIERFPKLDQCIVNQCESIKEDSKLHKQELIGASSRLSDQVGAQADIMEENTNKIIEIITEKSQNVEEKLNSISEILNKGFLQHQNHEVTFVVSWAEKESVADEIKDAVVVTLKINIPPCAEEEKAKIIKNVRKMIETFAIWSPYKIKYTGTGSVVIATMLNKDVYSDKEKFELSIRQFLDKFLSVSGIYCQSPCIIKVEILISKDIPKEIFKPEETNLLLAKYFDKEQQVAPELIGNFNEELPFVCSIRLYKQEKVFTEICLDETKEDKVLLVADRSDASKLRQIRQIAKSALSANVSEIDVRTLISSRQTNIEAVYVVLASSHTKRTIINTILNLIQCPRRVDLVPSDEMRYGYSTTESINIDEDQNWKKDLVSHIADLIWEEELTSYIEKKIPDIIRRIEALNHNAFKVLETQKLIEASDTHVCKDSDQSASIFVEDQSYGRNQKIIKPRIIQDVLDMFDRDEIDNRSLLLWIACLNDDTEKVRSLLEAHANTNLCSKKGISPIFIATKNKNKEIIKMLLEYNADVNKCTDDGSSPLIEACRRFPYFPLEYKLDANQCQADDFMHLNIDCRKVERQIVKMLLENKADVNKFTDDRHSPLYLACEKGDTEIVKMLLENKADVNKFTDDRHSPLYLACEKGDTEIVKMLLENKADVNKFTDDRHSPLYLACEKGDTEIVKMLLENKADVKSYGYLPLCRACQTGRADIVKMLLDRNADFNEDGSSLLCTACRNGNMEMVELLLGYKVQVNKINKRTTARSLPLHEACEKGDKEIVKILLQYKADVNQCTKEYSPLYIAYEKGETEIVQMLLEHRQDVNKLTQNGSTLLCEALKNGEKEIAMMLIENNADVNQCEDGGYSPLYQACKKGETKIVKMLLAQKADVNKCTIIGASPLFEACDRGATEIVRMLLEYDAEVNMSTVYGSSPLYKACEKGEIEIIDILLENKADVNQCIVDGNSPLYAACEKGETTIARMLLEYKADVHKFNNYGSSPLYVACKNGQTEIVKLLLQFKADVNKCCKDGKSPLEIARENGYTDIVRLIEENSAKMSC